MRTIPNKLGAQPAHSAQIPNNSMVWSTSEYPCSAATVVAHFLDRTALDLLGAPARPADEVMMVTLWRRSAVAVGRLTVRGVDHVDHPVVGERLQVPIDGRQPHCVTVGTQSRIDVLGTAEPAGRTQSVLHGRALPGRALLGCHASRLPVIIPSWRLAVISWRAPCPHGTQLRRQRGCRSSARVRCAS